MEVFLGGFDRSGVEEFFGGFFWSFLFVCLFRFCWGFFVFGLVVFFVVVVFFVLVSWFLGFF